MAENLLVPSGLVTAQNIQESQIRDVQAIPWAGAKIWQSSNSGNVSGRVHHVGATNIVFDTHGFYASGGTLRIPFAGIYEVTGHATVNGASAGPLLSAVEVWLGPSGGAFLTRVAYAGWVHTTGVDDSNIAHDFVNLGQGAYIRLTTVSGANLDYLGGIDHLWMAIRYLGPPRQSQVG